ncbi:hypothetical protein BGY98DRAFT_937693 [Russula aff. rugulosa BPL654]|nr:hypothetical protein BGY98DRAFT_937693 [Russula aff. rugulosa BPL654]
MLDKHRDMFCIQPDLQNLAVDDNDDDVDNDNNNISAEERRIILMAYYEILKFIPKLKTILPYQANVNEKYFYNVLLALQEAAMQPDLNHLINLPVQYKVLHGLNDPIICRRAGYLSGTLMITSTEMPLFLYENYMYKPDDPEEGLFQGTYLKMNMARSFLVDNAVDKVQELWCWFTSSAYTQDASPGDPNVGPSNSISNFKVLMPQAQKDTPLYPSTPWADIPFRVWPKDI